MPLIANILFWLTLFLTPCQSIAGQHALLIGVSDYIDPRIPDLEGPVNDVQALREVLISKWQFTDSDITTLLNSQATEAAILNAIDRLYDSTSDGDDIIIYYSGHGTSAADPDLGARFNLPDGSGAIVGSDFDPEKLNDKSFSTPTEDGLLVGRFEIRPKLQKLDNDRNVLVIFDACFSGNATREVASSYTPQNKRQIDLSAYLQSTQKISASTHQQNDLPGSKTRSLEVDADDKFAYQNTVYFGAAAENQFAVDLSIADIEAGLVTTIDGKPHGGFTDSLLRALWGQLAPTSSLTFMQLFNRAVNQFNTWCKSCGHTPVSLPTADASDNSLLSRRILTPSLLFSDNSEYNDTSEPTLQEAIVIDTSLINDAQLALRSLTSSTIDNKRDTSVITTPDIYFTQTENQMSAFASDGHLITQLPLSLSDEAMESWLAGRQWLKSRMLRDLQNQHGDLQVSFRHPLASNRVREGEYIHFNILNQTTASLVVLLLDANSELSLLYPVSESERHALLSALQTQRIPRQDEPQIQVTPPWGTDTVSFYSLPPKHSLKSTLRQLSSLSTIPMNHPALKAFENALDNDDVPYSAMTIRIVAERKP